MKHDKPREKDVADFISRAKHEIRTPVTVVKSFSQLLAKQATKEDFSKVEPYAQRMDARATELSWMMEVIFEEVKHLGGWVQWREEKFEFLTMLDELSRRYGEKVRVRWPEGKKAVVVVSDAKQLQRALAEVLGYWVLRLDEGKVVDIKIELFEEKVEVEIGAPISDWQESESQCFSEELFSGRQMQGQESGLGFHLAGLILRQGKLAPKLTVKDDQVRLKLEIPRKVT